MTARAGGRARMDENLDEKNRFEETLQGKLNEKDILGFYGKFRGRI
jgi:hypothetical protein